MNVIFVAAILMVKFPICGSFINIEHCEAVAEEEMNSY